MIWSLRLRSFFRYNLNFSSFRGEMCDLASLSGLILVLYPVSGEKRANRHLCQHWFSCLFKSKRKFGEDSLVTITTLLLPGVWAGWAPMSVANASPPPSALLAVGLACALCKAVSKQVTCKRKCFVSDPSDIQSCLLQRTVSRDREDVQKTGACHLTSS